MESTYRFREEELNMEYRAESESYVFPDLVLDEIVLGELHIPAEVGERKTDLNEVLAFLSDNLERIYAEALGSIFYLSDRGQWLDTDAWESVRFNLRYILVHPSESSDAQLMDMFFFEQVNSPQHFWHVQFTEGRLSGCSILPLTELFEF